jgi:hypothetical protein
MNGSTHLNSTDFSTETSSAFSPAVRFAPKELSLARAIRLIAYWASIIAIALVMGRSGFSYLRQFSAEPPGHHSVK